MRFVSKFRTLISLVRFSYKSRVPSGFKAWLAANRSVPLRMALRILRECPCEALRGVLRRYNIAGALFTHNQAVRPIYGVRVASDGNNERNCPPSSKPISTVPPTERERVRQANAYVSTVSVLWIRMQPLGFYRLAASEVPCPCFAFVCKRCCRNRYRQHYWQHYWQHHYSLVLLLIYIHLPAEIQIIRIIIRIIIYICCQCCRK